MIRTLHIILPFGEQHDFEYETYSNALPEIIYAQDPGIYYKATLTLIPDED